MNTASTSTQADRRPTRRLRLPSFGVQVLIGLALGVVLGLVARAMGPDSVDAAGVADPNWLTETLTTVGGVFVTLLRTIVPPLVFLAIVASIANLRDVTGAARLAWKTLAWFAITALSPWPSAWRWAWCSSPATTPASPPTPRPRRPRPAPGSTSSPASCPPTSSASRAAPGTTGRSACPSTCCRSSSWPSRSGIAALKVGSDADPFLGVVRSALTVVQKVLWWVILLAPIATVGLLGNAVATYGWDALGSLGTFTVAIYAGLALVLVGVYPILLRLNGLSVKQFFSGAWPAISLAFVSRSSVGTMPLTQSVTERNLGVPRAYASFAVPLGATTKMDGCASIYPAISAIFVAQFFGLDLSITDYVLIAFVSVIGSAATAGVTGATVMLTLTLSTLGLPLEGVGLLLAIDPILDMGRTATNVAGQALVPTIVAKREGILDVEAYNARRTGRAWREDATPDQELVPA